MARLAALLVALIVSGVGIAFVSAVAVNMVPVQPSGTLAANISIGPTQPVCTVQPTDSPPPSSYGSVKAVITDSARLETIYPVDWTSNGCYVTGSLSVSLPAGSYSFNLTSCNWMGCRSALPKSFDIRSGQTTELSVSIFTGIA